MCSYGVESAYENSNLDIWIPAIVSIFALVANIVFSIFMSPRVNFRFQKREAFANTANELLQYLSDVISYDDFSGVPTKIRNYSLRIHLLFKAGTAPSQIAECLEDIWQMAKNRKTIVDKEQIIIWEDKFRSQARYLRCSLSKYTGVF